MQWVVGIALVPPHSVILSLQVISSDLPGEELQPCSACPAALPAHTTRLSEIHLAELEIPHPKARVLKLCDCISVTQQAEENNLEKVQKLNGSSPFPLPSFVRILLVQDRNQQTENPAQRGSGGERPISPQPLVLLLRVTVEY